MPVVVTDIQIAFATGALFADAGAPVILAAREAGEAALAKAYGRYLLRALAYPGLFLLPAATLFLLAYPAWETQYLSAAFDHLTGNPANGASYAAFMMAAFGGAWFGNWLGFRWVLRGLRTRLRVLYVALIAASFALFFARWPAPVRVGSYAAYERDPGALPYVTEDATFFTAFLILLLLSSLPILVGFVQVRREVKRIP